MSQMITWVWKLVYRPHNLWARWTKQYILKDSDIWQAKASPSFSWYWHNVLYARDHFLTTIGSPSLAIQCLQNFTHGLKFITLLDVKDCLPTIDRLIGRGLYLVNRCSLCECASENVSHLFFACSYAQTVWSSLLDWIHVTYSPTDLPGAFSWILLTQSLDKRHIRSCLLLATVYYLWQERNRRIFAGLQRPPEVLGHLIRFAVCSRLCV
ncbi:uncharacterized protein LOC141643784 [Silene latifolia]|uniref:uncharacterized protein LOC141643784 n=1 Tax=Silene latifolia TaxID=37657 RepID=UPI003D787A22